MTLELSHLNRRFAEYQALDDVSLQIAPGEFLALLGPSGSGKTTLLRILAGLDYPDTGSVLKDGKDFLATNARERNIGMVFQHYALFRHLTVLENIAFGLRVRPWRKRPSRAVIRERVERLLKRVQLDGLGRRYPSQLSGGQRQRVALARALAVEPDMLLLDEPFGALDAQVRVTLRRWLRELHEELDLTTVFVTHDQEEALELADRVAVMNNGRVEQVGSPEMIYQQPATPFVCEFIGKVNRFIVRRNGTGWAAGGWQPGDDPWQGRYHEAVAYVRPEQLRLAVPASQPAWEARLRHIYLAGSVAHLELHVESLGQPLEADIASEDLSRLGLHAGMELRVAPRGAVLFPRDGQGATLNHERWIWHARSPVPA
ncbi:sulfate/molybdate ABC transporter ATP-binding protein [Dyella jiangningensis]|uniref:Sulfate ABC transporter ATP-binding protein n=1 Tax=Dyella jiangningensis TaxID=1379159 RepID=A0A328P749_9GAMM|nr:TOBE-like domain-containing protein [Dyella jiangningensis]RAO77879.1 sulfate ABC transporter ATP-binding protein [Dyella jiangningensis]